MKSAETILIHTFCSANLSGSPQYIHIYGDEETRRNEFSKFKVLDDFDHSFVTISKNYLRVSWKNKAGAIQFCGSGAYGVSWLLLKKLKHEKTLIESENICLEAKVFKNKLVLDIPARLPQLVKRSEDHNIFCDITSGVYFIQLKDLGVLERAEWRELIYLVEDKDIHGLCLFFWCDKTSKGYLRYFTPWHGRDEDYVTGSVHQYLTPLIHELYGENEQTWNQLSSLGGALNSKYCLNKVLLSGNCFIEENHRRLK